MAVQFSLPEVSEGVDSAEVSEIHVAEGDVIETGQTVMEVETEKAVAPVECPHAGTVTKIHVSEGDTVPVGGTLLTIEATSDVPAAAGAAAGGGSGGSQTTSAQIASARRASGTGAEPVSTSHPEPAPPAGAFPFRGEGGSNGSASRPPAPAAPSVRRLARELGVDLHAVSGSARGGRILAEDVKAFAEGGGAGDRRLSVPGRGGVDPALLPVRGGAGAPMAAPDLPDFAQYGEISRERMNKLSRTAAANLSYAWQAIPHVTQQDEADITDLEAARKAFVDGPGRNGPKVTMTAILVKACVAALKEHPQFNASLDLGSGEVILKHYYHIGIAVDTDAGLMVPVLRDADQKSILQIATDLTDIAVRARDRKLSMDEMRGGTFTISNLGGIGGSFFTPIVNYPEVAILGVSRGRKELALNDGQPVERLKLPLSLSYDHRVINGADGARFIKSLNGNLSDFMTLLVSA